KERDSVAPSAHWWAARTLLAQQSLLDYPAQTLLEQITAHFEKARAYMPHSPASDALDRARTVDEPTQRVSRDDGEASVPQVDDDGMLVDDEHVEADGAHVEADGAHVEADGAKPEDNPGTPVPETESGGEWDRVPVADRELWARYLVELGVVYSQHSMPLDAKRYTLLAQAASGLQWEMTGAKGRRTRFQTFDITQLVLLARSARRVDTRHNPVPETMRLNDDVLLESIKFTGEERVADAEDLQVIDKCILLALCLNVQNENPAHGLTSEQMMPFVTRVLQHTTNWSVYTMGLLVRSRLEAGKPRTVERATLQLQQLVDQITHPLPGSEEAGAAERLQFLFALSLPSQWALERELATQFMSLGVVRSSLDIFERLHMWDDVIACYTMLEQTDVAERIVQRELEKSPQRPKLWCVLGDLKRDPEHWRHAWEVSGQRYARAMRSLGAHHFARHEYADAIACYEKAVRLNPLFENSWYVMGCAAMSVEQWQTAARAFLHVVGIDENNGESWNNLATAYLRMGPEFRVRALHALRQSVKYLNSSWRVWSNLMRVAMSLGLIATGIQAMSKLVDLRADEMGAECIDLDVLRSIISSVTRGSAFAGLAEDEARAKERRLTAQIEALLVRKIEARVSSSAPVWRAMADYWFWRHDYVHCLDCYVKAYRCISQMPQVSYAPPVFSDAVNAALELVSMYENLGDKTQVVRVAAAESTDQQTPADTADADVVSAERKTVAVEQPVCADWKHQTKMLLRGLIGKGKESFDGTPAFTRLTDALSELRQA
ncbi:hypothetical protein IWW50_003903, partial [Coemansia erecta]